MLKKTVLILLSLLVISVVCVFLFPRFFGTIYLRLSGEFKPPQYESLEGILKPLKNNDVHYDRLYRLANQQSMVIFQEKNIFEVPFLQIFNGQKKLIKSASGNECTWSFMEYFTNSDSIRLIEEDSMMYYFIHEQLSPVDSSLKPDSYEYYVLAGWANFAPKLSKRLFEQTNEIKAKLEDRVCISYISMDFREEWEDVDSDQSMSKK